MMRSVYLWEGRTLQGDTAFGIERGRSRRHVRHKLRNRGYFNLTIRPIPTHITHSPLSTERLLEVLQALAHVLSSGASLRESLILLVKSNSAYVTRYVFSKLNVSLHKGHSLERSFADMKPLFPGFFVAMVSLSEKTGKLAEGLQSLIGFYGSREERKNAMEKALRYPKIVFGLTLLLGLGIVVFIIPMFDEVYALFQGDLPIPTKGLVYLSETIRSHWIPLGAAALALSAWFYLPKLKHLHPVAIVSRLLRTLLLSQEDRLLYAHAMKILLESGQPVRNATQIARDCLTERNRKHGAAIAELLDSGMSFSQAFSRVSWFPPVYRTYIESAEKAGLLQIGFQQIFRFIERERENRFEKFSKLVEPLLILAVGGAILVLLLAVYLPIFEMGNRLT